MSFSDVLLSPKDSLFIMFVAVFATSMRNQLIYSSFALLLEVYELSNGVCAKMKYNSIEFNGHTMSNQPFLSFADFTMFTYFTLFAAISSTKYFGSGGTYQHPRRQSFPENILTHVLSLMFIDSFSAAHIC